MDKNHLNPIKSKFSLAYLHAVAAQADVVVHPTPLDVDMLGLDIKLYKKLSNTLEGALYNNEVSIQLKGTSINTTMVKEDDDSFKYHLGEELVKFSNMYLVIVILPSDDACSNWLKQDANSITISRCAYYIKIDKDFKRGTVTFPKANLLTPEAMLNMFKINKEDL